MLSVFKDNVLSCFINHLIEDQVLGKILQKVNTFELADSKTSNSFKDKIDLFIDIVKGTKVFVGLRNDSIIESSKRCHWFFFFDQFDVYFG